jgi:exodeoxyribonuclease VII small subunit
MKSEKTQQTFEEAMSRLEEIVGLLENGGADLEDTMKLYTEGAKLAEVCSRKLDKAEQVIIKMNDKKTQLKDETEHE